MYDGKPRFVPQVGELMHARAPHVSAHPTAVGDEVLRLVRQLIRQVRDARGPGISADDVMLDVEVNDVRCMLVSQHRSRGSDYSRSALSPREEEIVRMVGAGYSNKTIAAALGISSWTVSTHLRRVFAKLDVHSRAAMVARIVGHGL